jgi:hypothetical protein
MSHVFVSYNTNSGDFIDILRKKLEDKQFEVWIFLVGGNNQIFHSLP